MEYRLIFITGRMRSGKTTLAENLSRKIKIRKPKEVIGLFSLSQDVRMSVESLITKDLISAFPDDLVVQNDISKGIFCGENSDDKILLQSVGKYLHDTLGSISVLTFRRISEFLVSMASTLYDSGTGVTLIIEGVRYDNDIFTMLGLVKNLLSPSLTSGNKVFYTTIKINRKSGRSADNRNKAHDTELHIDTISANIDTNRPDDVDTVLDSINWLWL